MAGSDQLRVDMAVRQREIMYLIIIGLIVSVSSIALMRPSNNALSSLGMFLFIAGIYLIKIGRAKIKKNN
jgi:hypothetical protein